MDDKLRIYLVGGTIRDRYMGVESKDTDLVVVGSTHEEMLRMGFRQIGKDFPIYTNQSGAEFSLARRSRKGDAADFGPEVTLEEDLLKRDLTMNAMAWVHGDYYDPFGGRADIDNKIFRMVRPSSFMEDPIRVLRVARFAARYPDFTVDPDTLRVMQGMVMEGKLDNPVAERVWKELSRGLMEVQPSRMLRVLRECGALKVILPEVDALYGVPQPEQWHPEVDTGRHIEQVIDYAASQHFELAVRFAGLLHDVGKALSPKDTLPAHHGHEGDGEPLARAICERLKVPDTIARVAIMTTREHGNIHGAMKMKHTSITRVLRKCDAFRNPDRFQQMLQACMCDARGRYSDNGGASFIDVGYPQAMRFSNALWIARQVKGGDIAEKFKDRPEYIPVEIHAARARAIKTFERNQKNNQPS